jgi:hypothetical protein
VLPLLETYLADNVHKEGTNNPRLYKICKRLIANLGFLCFFQMANKSIPEAMGDIQRLPCPGKWLILFPG